MLLPLQGARFMFRVNPGRCPGLSAFGPSARACVWLYIWPPIYNYAHACFGHSLLPAPANATRYIITKKMLGLHHCKPNLIYERVL